MGLIKDQPSLLPDFSKSKSLDECFKPFMFDGLVSLTGSLADQCSVRILRDTACSQSVILTLALPFSDQSACGYGAVLHGMEMGFALRPVHCIHVESTLVTVFFPCCHLS